MITKATFSEGTQDCNSHLPKSKKAALSHEPTAWAFLPKGILS